MRILTAAVFFIALAGYGCGPQPDAAADLEGVWYPQDYILKAGDSHRVAGQIFFSGESWSVLFFVLDGEGEPVRGSAEGGTFTLAGDRLTFTHNYHFSAGETAGSLPASPLRMSIRKDIQAAAEPCRVTFPAGELRIHFPSGNIMVFRRERSR